MDKSQKKAKGKKKAVIKDLEEKDAEKVKGGVLISTKLFPKVESPSTILSSPEKTTLQFPKVE